MILLINFTLRDSFTKWWWFNKRQMVILEWSWITMIITKIRGSDSDLIQISKSSMIRSTFRADLSYNSFSLLNLWQRYKRTIKGTVQSGTVMDLKGVSVRILLVWIPITGVHNSGDELTFSIGPISKSFPISDFNESPHCRRESECANGVHRVVADS